MCRRKQLWYAWRETNGQVIPGVLTDRLGLVQYPFTVTRLDLVMKRTIGYIVDFTNEMQATECILTQTHHGQRGFPAVERSPKRNRKPRIQDSNSYVGVAVEGFRVTKGTGGRNDRRQGRLRN